MVKQRSSGPLTEMLTDTAAAFEVALSGRAPELESSEVGTVTKVSGGIVKIDGLPSITADELVAFPGKLYGIAINLDEAEVGVMMLNQSEKLSAGAVARRTGRIADTPVGEGLIGRVIDANGKVLDEGGALQFSERLPIERPAPSILDRSPVSIPLETGIKAVDALVPIGRGQRELIVGDRQTGKTAIAIDTILNQRDKNVLCIYCAIGQRRAAVARVLETLKTQGAMEYTMVVVASGDDTPGLQFITPYAATSMAEFFVAQGRDVLIVYDDLTRHARVYREVSLLMRRPPGREAFPGDIFYIHSRLLERATQLSEAAGGGSLTALPIVETQAQDISAYIPTNLISITDGQIYLSPQLFYKGQFPAVDIGKSVSRVGGKTQFPAFRAISGELRLAYSQFEELEAFSRLATRLDESTLNAIEHGRRVREILKQEESSPVSTAAQVAVLKAVTLGLFDAMPLESVIAAGQAIQTGAIQDLPDLCKRVGLGLPLDDEDWQELLTAAQKALESGGFVQGAEQEADGNN